MIININRLNKKSTAFRDGAFVIQRLKVNFLFEILDV